MDRTEKKIIDDYGAALLAAGRVEGELGLAKSFEQILNQNPMVGLEFKNKFLPNSESTLKFIEKFEFRVGEYNLELYAVFQPKLEQAKEICLKAIAFYRGFKMVH
ncbi:MAG TPA: hypothetical protein VJC39_05290 [Candidatus Nanoarchaeia archaeon]|nr:hypothetical protein [Candidatus Nanoarchaeia archaeon]